MIFKEIFSEALRRVLRYKKLILIAAAAVIALLFISNFVKRFGTAKREMYFTVAGTDTLEKEIRYLPKKNGMTELQTYVSELLLGPQIHRVRPLFTLGTSLENCFQQNGTTYIFLSEDAVFQESEAVEFERGVELLKENIRRNFPKISNIEIFVDGVCIE